MKKLSLFITLVLFIISGVYSQCTDCNQTVNTGQYSSAIGTNTEALGIASFAAGTYSEAIGNTSIALGMRNISSGIQAITLGSFVHSTGAHSITIGSGYGLGNELINAEAYSLMIGFNSNMPTLFIGKSSGMNRSGKIGIGNITNPQAKLHLLADEGEVATIFIQPHNWENNESATLLLGSDLSSISANKVEGISFNSESNYLFNSGGFVGINTVNPEASLHINEGDIYLEDINSGIIMKSPDGKCWRGQLNDDGQLSFSILENCPGTTSGVQQSNINNQNIKVFPNPTKDYFNIEIENNSEKLEMRLISIDGVVMKTKNFRGTFARIYVGDIAPGTYFIKVAGKSSDFSKTVTVL